MNPFQIKILCAVVLWAISVTFGVLLPYFLWKISQHSRANADESEEEDSERDSHCDNESESLILTPPRRPTRFPACCNRLASFLRVKVANGNFSSIIYCLCGGVFLGVSLLDLIPQSRSAVNTVFEVYKTTTSYPVAEFMVTLGLLLVMVIENLVSEAVLPKNSYGPHAESPANIIEGHYSGRYRPSAQVRDSVSTYRMYILVITLSLHSVFEGLAIGLQKELSTLVQLLVAVSIHKAVLTFGVGLPLFETLGRLGKARTAVFCSMIFCSASPIGCFAGAFVSSDYSSSPAALLASAVLQCLATGTFLYVTFVEVIPREFSHHSKKNVRQAKRKPEEIYSRHDQQSIDSSLPDHGDREDESSTAMTDTADCEHGRNAKVERQPRLGKLLALVVGFAIASGLQFL